MKPVDVAALRARTKWVQKMDPENPGMAIITMRIPAGEMPTATYSGEAAVDRFQRFIAGVNSGAAMAERGPVGDV